MAMKRELTQSSVSITDVISVVLHCLSIKSLAICFVFSGPDAAEIVRKTIPKQCITLLGTHSGSPRFQSPHLLSLICTAKEFSFQPNSLYFLDACLYDVDGRSMGLTAD